jgi:hypothetical protein
MREIDLLIGEAERGRLVVEKDTNRLWDRDELREARAGDVFTEEDEVRPVAADLPVTSPFPGCLQLPGALDDLSESVRVGHTRNFVLFERPRRG